MDEAHEDLMFLKLIFNMSKETRLVRLRHLMGPIEFGRWVFFKRIHAEIRNQKEP